MTRQTRPALRVFPLHSVASEPLIALTLFGGSRSRHRASSRAQQQQQPRNILPFPQPTTLRPAA